MFRASNPRLLVAGSDSPGLMACGATPPESPPGNVPGATATSSAAERLRQPDAARPSGECLLLSEVVQVAVEDNDTHGTDRDAAVAVARDVLAGLQ